MVANPIDGIARLAAAHACEDVGGFVGLFAADGVWVTSRGVRLSGRYELEDYLRSVIPGGLGDGSVRYEVVETLEIRADVVVTFVEQVYTDRNGRPRSPGATHSHSYVWSRCGDTWAIRAGQNTVLVNP